MALREDLPYRCEYAKTGRASCKGCKESIPAATLRMAVMVQSPFFDGKQPNWHHFQCFFNRFRPKVEDIAHFAALKYDDQKRVEEAIELSCGSTNGDNKSKKKTTKKKKKSDEDNSESKASDFSEYKVQYSPSNRAKCRLCENTITKGSVRVSRLDRDSEDARRYGPLDRWFHVECFVKARESLSFFASADKLPFFDTLEENDKKDLKKRLPQMKRPIDDQNGGNGSPAKKLKLSKAEDKALKQQSDLIFSFIEFLKTMKKQDLIDLLDSNKIAIPEGMSSKWERLSDAMAFGRPDKCPECKKGQLVFRTSGYICTGNITEWSKCEYQTTGQPKRKPFKVPKHLAEEYPFLKDYKYKSRDRIYNPVLKQAVESSLSTPSTSGLSTAAVVPKSENNDNNESTVSALNGYNICFVGKLKTTKPKLKTRLTKLGATLSDRTDRTTLFIVSTKTEFNKQSERILEAKELLVPIVAEDILTAIESDVHPIQAIGANRLDDFEVDVEKRFTNLNVKEKMKSAFKSGSGTGRFEKSVGKQKMVIKDGNVVDPECEVSKVTHIYKSGDEVFSVVLSKVDLSTNKNSYYKLQLLQHDSKANKYWVFRSWGRVGTTIGGQTLDPFKSVDEAIDHFISLYKEKTNNDWNKRKKFKKYPDFYFPVDIDYGSDATDLMASLTPAKSSSLPKAVQELICQIFDVKKMKEQMLEFELDLEKMPLGKISKKQLLKACSVLKELSQLIDTKPVNNSKLKDATNRFFTLIPHNFGTDRPPIIDNEKMIKDKMEVLESLLDIEMAYEMITSTDESTKDLDPIDQHYHKLNTKIQPMSKEEEEYAVIERYLKNTHGSTHHFSLDIIDVFKVERNGEYDRYLKFEHLDNKMLLWHGSRVTNFAGILSQGLRIAPPEAPVTGYMFGKGIYFADMVTKSAGYCHHHSNGDIGYLLLSEVAVGQTLELFDAKDVKKLPKNKHSVKGLGRTEPDPNETHVLPNGVKVPLGPAVEVKEKKCSLLYNEFIVYDVNQVNIKYLLKCKFNSKSLFG